MQSKREQALEATIRELRDRLVEARRKLAKLEKEDEGSKPKSKRRTRKKYDSDDHVDAGPTVERKG